MKNWILYVFLTLFLISSSLLAKAPIIPSNKIKKNPKKVIRVCCSFGDGIKMKAFPFKKISSITAYPLIGNHKYLGSPKENNGIIYTQKGGFIDLAHTRDYVDWTAYWYSFIHYYNDLDTIIVKKLGKEAGSKTIQIDLRKKLSENEMISLAGSIAYDLSIWHEVSTWFGASSVPLIHEKNSSFSPEDQYSNLLGVVIGMEAIKSPLDFNTAVTQILDRYLLKMIPSVTIEETKNAFKKVDQLWWDSRKSIPNRDLVLKRYINTQNELLPWLISSHSEPIPLKIPLDFNDSLKKCAIFKVKTNHLIKKNSDLKKLGIGRVISNLDFPVILRYLEKEIEAIEQKY
ncbi:MAG: DUF4056 domain-containing protein [Flavobacteriales bacterium]|jgi:hypothetical protein|nr:DUF4056 domain-containing protein [Flavobacteriales bacterium]